ncbi:unnamed protein product [Didymodactylos carnosus]|uniref:Uncharacterized protein n=1 Tax=Didymodactylos carnosus TaxID=1234261 RepID=A0A816A416_9BILA|nr:unnamed protein product [Didymodactylos carnosus]CAF4463490.1 unnamed protein product [Didymodactylos carnosus]
MNPSIFDFNVADEVQAGYAKIKESSAYQRLYKKERKQESFNVDKFTLSNQSGCSDNVKPKKTSVLEETIEDRVSQSKHNNLNLTMINENNNYEEQNNLNQHEHQQEGITPFVCIQK